MKRFLMIILSFIFLGGAVTGSAFLLSGCDSVQTETSGGGNSQDENLNNEENSENNEQNEENSGNQGENLGEVDDENPDYDEEVTVKPQSSFNISIKINNSSYGSFSAGIESGTSVSNRTSAYTLTGNGSYAWISANPKSGYTSSIEGISTSYVYVYFDSSNKVTHVSPTFPSNYLIGNGSCSTTITVSFKAATTSYSNTINYSSGSYAHSTNISISGPVSATLSEGGSRSYNTTANNTVNVTISTTNSSYDYQISVSGYGTGENSLSFNYKSTSTKTLNVYVTEIMTLSYDGNNATSGSMSPQTALYGDSLTVASNGFRRTNHSFLYFSTSPSGGTIYRPRNSITMTSNVTLYARWSYNPPITYNYIYYYPNGGTGNNLTQNKQTGYDVSIYTQSQAGYSRSGYSFTGWNTRSDGTGTSYSAGQTYSSNANLSLYAQWERITYTITYNGNGATGGSTASTTVNAGSSVALRLNGFTRTGYSFSGWATSASGSKVYSNGQTITPTGNMTLYAVWVDDINPTISRVTYAQNGGTSYYAYAYASDSGSGLNRVQFPTWTANYDQDDIEWYTGTAGSWTVGGQTYNYRYLVQASNHDNEYGTYITHVYAYDNAGNSVGNGSMTNIRMTSSVKVNPNGGTYNGSSATSSTTQNSGKTLGLNFARAGYNLSNVTSTAGTLSKSQVTGTMTFSGSNYVNLGRTYMYSNKLTWAVTAYMDNWSQYQSGNMRLISCTQTGGFNLEPNGSTVRFAVYDRARGGYNSITTSVTWASLSGWVQFAMVFDGHYARGYINGELVGTSKNEYTNGIGYHASNAIFIGAEAGSNATKPAGNYFKGKIRSVHIINEAVNQEDLANLDNQYALYVKGNTTVTASWSVATYTVSYNANGGTMQGLNYIMRTKNYSGTYFSELQRHNWYCHFEWNADCKY